MEIRKKLAIIQKMRACTQGDLAYTLGVSLVTINQWMRGKSEPREGKQALIDALFREVTGQKSISREHLIAKNEGLLAQKSTHNDVMREILDHPDIRDQFVLKLTYHSNSIEGSTLTEPDTAAVLFDNVALPHKSLSEQLEAKNHQTALLYVFEHVAKRKPLNEAFILKLHSILMNGVQPDAGVYRNHAVRIVGVNLPTANYVSVPRLIPNVVRDITRRTKDTVHHIATVHSTFEQIHPFSGGNGRVGRLLMNAMLLRANIAPAIIRQQHKQLYYTYLYKAQTKHESDQLEDYLYDAIAEGYRVLDRADAE